MFRSCSQFLHPDLRNSEAETKILITLEKLTFTSSNKSRWRERKLYAGFFIIMLGNLAPTAEGNNVLVLHGKV